MNKFLFFVIAAVVMAGVIVVADSLMGINMIKNFGLFETATHNILEKASGGLIVWIIMK